MSGRKALVLGATGHFGQAMVRELLAHGYQVTAATRQARPTGLVGLDVTIARGDADSPGQLDAWVSGHDAVIDAAAPYPLYLFIATSPAEQDPLAYARRRTAALLEAVVRHGAQLGFVSSFTTLPRREMGLGFLEARWRRRLHPYFAVKQLMESMVLDAARRGLPATIINPPAYLGPWDENRRNLAPIPLLLRRALPTAGQGVVNVIDVRDAASGLRAAMEAECHGVPIPLCGHNLEANELAWRICALGRVAPPPLRFPARLNVGAALGMEAVWALAGRASPIPALAVLLQCDSGPRGIGSVQQRLGIYPRPLDVTLGDAISWYRWRGFC
jgi:dihydroflavonol-4-reductase